MVKKKGKPGKRNGEEERLIQGIDVQLIAQALAKLDDPRNPIYKDASKARLLFNVLFLIGLTGQRANALRIKAALAWLDRKGFAPAMRVEGNPDKPLALVMGRLPATKF